MFLSLFTVAYENERVYTLSGPPSLAFCYQICKILATFLREVHEISCFMGFWIHDNYDKSDLKFEFCYSYIISVCLIVQCALTLEYSEFY